MPGGPPPPLLMCHRAEQPGGQRSGRQCGPGAGEGPCVCVAVCPAPPPRPPQPPRILHPSGVGGAPARLGRCRGAAGLPHGGGDRRWPEWVPRAEGDPFFLGGCPPPPHGASPGSDQGRVGQNPPHTPPPSSPGLPTFSPHTPYTNGPGAAMPRLPPPEMNWIKPGEAPPLRTDSASPAAGRCGQLPAEPGEQDRQQHGLWFPFGPPAGHVSSSEGCRWVLAPPPRPTVLTRCLTGVTQGMPKAAGSAPSSCTRWIPARTHIPTSSPRRRPVTSTKFSVSGPEGRKGAGGEHREGAPCRAGPPSPVGTPPPPQLLCLGSCSHPRASAPTPAAPLSSSRSSQREAGVPGCLQQPDVSPAAC